MGDWLREWGGLLSSVVLIAVTGWYVYLTKKLADSAKASANSSKEAAEASLSAVAAAVASVSVDFGVFPSGYVDRGRDRFALQVMCMGATVFVHSARLIDLGVEDAERARVVDWGFNSGDAMPLHVAGKESVPRRLHKGETIFFFLPSECGEPVNVAALELIVDYSLDGRGPVIGRRIYWEDEEWTLGIDEAEGGGER